MMGTGAIGDPSSRRFVATVVLLAVGAALAPLVLAGGPAASPAFFTAATALLVVGLFASTYSIPRLRSGELRVVLLAVTVGVLLKAVVIGAALALSFGEPAYLLLGAVMAQIDPLSVAALRASSRLSERGRAVLAAWASFDDPVTSLVVVLAVAGVGHLAPSADPAAGAAALTYPLPGLLGSVALVAVAALVWWGLTVAFRRRPGDPERAAFTVTAGLALIAMAVAAVEWFLVVGIAAVGLVFRPRIGRILDGLTAVAFAVAVVLLGVVAGGGVDLVPGLVLGAVTYGAQILVAGVVARSLPGPDRVRLALAQQSGITAVVLALLVEPVLPGTAAIVAPAVLVVNLLHLIANAVLERASDHRWPGATAVLSSRSGATGVPAGGTGDHERPGSSW